MKINIKVKPRDPNAPEVGKWFTFTEWESTDCYEIHEIRDVTYELANRQPITKKEVVTKYEGKDYTFEIGQIKIIPYGTKGHLFRRSGGLNNQY